MLRVFKITNYTGNINGQDLLGLLVIEINKVYFLVDPEYMLEEPTILSTALINLTTPPLGSFNFPFKKLPWTLNIDSVSSTEVGGTWTNSEDPPGVDDTWTATGTGIGAGGDDEARAASAK